MTYYFNILFFLHIFGIACYAYLYYDVKLIRNENFFKWFQDKTGICKKEDYEHSQKYIDNVAYKALFDETFHKFKVISVFIILNYVISILIFGYLKFSIRECIDPILNIHTIPIIIVAVVVEEAYYLYFIYPEYKNVSEQINSFRTYFQPALILFVYCSSFLITASVVCFLNYNMPDPESEEKIVKIKDVTKVLYEHSGLFERKHYNVLVVEPAIYGDRFISVSDETLNKARKGNKLKATIKKGLFGARFIEKEEILLK